MSKGSPIEKLYTEEFDKIVGLCWHLLGNNIAVNKQIAYDITSAVFLRLLEQKNKIDIKHLRGYAYQSAKHGVYDYKKIKPRKNRF